MTNAEVVKLLQFKAAHHTIRQTKDNPPTLFAFFFILYWIELLSRGAHSYWKHQAITMDTNSICYYILYTILDNLIEIDYLVGIFYPIVTNDGLMRLNIIYIWSKLCQLDILPSRLIKGTVEDRPGFYLEKI